MTIIRRVSGVSGWCYDAVMKRTTISLPDDLAAAAEREARRRRTSVADVARVALAEHLGFSGRSRQLPFAAIADSGHTDTAANFEEILAREWHPDRDR